MTGRHRTLLATAAACLSLFSMAVAQESVTDRLLLACDGIADPAERLACFNRVVEGLRPDSGAPESVRQSDNENTDVAPVAEPSPVPPAPSAADAVPPVPEAEPAPAPAPAVDATPSPAPPAAQPAPVSDSRPEAQPSPVPAARPEAAVITQAPAPAGRAPDTSGKAANRAADGEDQSGGGLIVRVWERHDGRFTVKLSNGQYWRETEGSRVGIPNVGDAVEIKRGMFGSYRMKIDGIPRLAWVRQTD